ncbi:probable xyloglucan endotransglucosylase/hydrolase protein 33 [Phalaenopsis equestris]|uniref:probable xyloglucan endotransglucosylase/hydrolase protein 33 n=1 Tax=Phalaenopsis equestris TaxID=78828 RepID=UPI0009E5795E|nr:probable xyloglucan endotransglucosylase/hydrolase protein 33 [Phalaenopsis equestris]
MEVCNYSKQQKLWLLSKMVVCCVICAESVRHGLTPPSTTKLTELFPRHGYEDKFLDFYGGKNVQKVNNGSAVNLLLDKSSGSGYRSKDVYYHGFFSAAIKLPSGFTAGVVVAFYVSFFSRTRERLLCTNIT